MSALMPWPFDDATSERPSSRMPVPASRMTSQSVSVRTSTHGVLPPYRTVVGPGDGIDPRVPQNRNRNVMRQVPQCFADRMGNGDAKTLGKVSRHPGDCHHTELDVTASAATAVLVRAARARADQPA